MPRPAKSRFAETVKDTIHSLISNQALNKVTGSADALNRVGGFFSRMKGETLAELGPLTASKEKMSDLIKASTDPKIADSWKKSSFGRSGIDLADATPDEVLRHFDKDLRGVQNPTPELAQYRADQDIFDKALARDRGPAMNDFAVESFDHFKRLFTTDPALGGGLGLAKRVGMYGAANIGFRYLRGGSATRNPRGERDIAGIPLI